VDVSRSRVARARRRFPGISFDDRGIGALSDYRNVFDLIVMDNVIEHLPRPLETLAQLRNCLVAGGTLVAITPNMESGHFRLLGRRWTAELSPHAHIFLFTESALRRSMTEAGLQVRAAGDFHLPSALDFAVREFRRTRGVKDLVWRLGHEAAAIWGHLIRSGEMIYTVADSPRGSTC
jgi:SAM-dependent methyltransferase